MIRNRRRHAIALPSCVMMAATGRDEMTRAERAGWRWHA